MGARAATVWFLETDDAATMLRSDTRNDTQHAHQVAAAIYGDSVLVPVTDTDLATAAAARDTHVYAGFYGPLCVVSCTLFETTTPSMLTRTLNAIRPSAATTLLYTDPETGLGAFARWEKGRLRRSFAADLVTIHEDHGLPFTFEKPFWGGEHPLDADDAPNRLLTLPFHPGQLAEEANRHWLGFRYTRPWAPTDLDPTTITVTCFALHPPEYEPTAADHAAYREAAAAHAGRAVPAGIDGKTGQAPRKRGRIREYFGF